MIIKRHTNFVFSVLDTDATTNIRKTQIQDVSHIHTQDFSRCC